MDSISLRIQGLPTDQQTLVLARLAQGRTRSNRFMPRQVEDFFSRVGLPIPPKISNQFASLERRGLLARGGRVVDGWTLTPKGRATVDTLLTDADLAGLSAEIVAFGGSVLGDATHPLVPVSLAPPELLTGIRPFLDRHPFERNVFGMTRFPEGEDDNDPVAAAVEIARHACASHGLVLHLASDQVLVDSLWMNVSAHMWASKFGIGFFEDRAEEGLSYNLTIEVGAMLMAGRRCALLKDSSIERLPSDLVGHIYKSVDLDRADTVAIALHSWLRDDLHVSSCDDCP